MKSLVLSFLVLFIFSSCLVVKIYESPVSEETTYSKPNEVHREMIRSGKVIKLGEQGESEDKKKSVLRTRWVGGLTENKICNENEVSKIIFFF